MNGGTKYGDVALGVEAALPAIRLDQRSGCGYTRLRRTLMRRTLIWFYAALKRWA